mgnify:CR=1 FL=1
MRAEDFGINIDKLSIATDDAGKEFKAAVARSGGLPLSSRDGELEELRQIVVAKDRSISSLSSTQDGQRSALGPPRANRHDTRGAGKGGTRD